MKIYDFSPDKNMSPVIGLLHAMVSYNFERLKRLVEGMTQSEIDYRGPDESLNSIAQLVRHLAVVDFHWVFRLQSSNIPADLIEVYGLMYEKDGTLPNVRNISLQTLIEQYEQVQEMFKQLCITLTDDDLERVVPFENGNKATVRWGIWHIADHSRHHYANIAQLKKMQK